VHNGAKSQNQLSLLIIECVRATYDPHDGAFFLIRDPLTEVCPLLKTPREHVYRHTMPCSAKFVQNGVCKVETLGKWKANLGQQIHLLSRHGALSVNLFTTNSRTAKLLCLLLLGFAVVVFFVACDSIDSCNSISAYHTIAPTIDIVHCPFGDDDAEYSRDRVVAKRHRVRDTFLPKPFPDCWVQP
jgi:hypothetical protein